MIASEDGRFCNHWGVDWAAVKDAVQEARKRGRGFRGASTIPMQTAKNLYLWTDRSYVRKVLEVPLAYLLTIFWPKERVIEVYLNIAQWGPGIFGAEAASQHYFRKSASQLTRREALLLAVSLPAPRLRNPGKPSPRMLRMAKAVERQDAGPRRALGLRGAATGTTIGLWPAAGVSHYKGAHSRAPRHPAVHFRRLDNGCTQEKNLPHEAGQPPLPRRARRAGLCRGQGARASFAGRIISI